MAKQDQSAVATRTRQGAVLPKLLTLKEAAEALGVAAKSLRLEVGSGRLRCFRARPGSTSKIMLDPADVLEWLHSHAGQRQRAPRPGG